MIICNNASENQVKSFLDDGFLMIEKKSPYELIRLRSSKHFLDSHGLSSPVSIVLFTTGKVVIYSNKDDFDFFKRLALEKGCVVNNSSVKKLSSNKQYHDVVGSDEVLKGDTFGGLVVVGTYFSEDEEVVLERLGVVDSKKLSDVDVKKIATLLMERFPDRIVIRSYYPEEYNSFLEKNNQTSLLNKLHDEVGKVLKERFSKEVRLRTGNDLLHLVDEYPGCSVGDFRETQAESKSIAVASASIIARNESLEQLASLSEKAGFNLPRGSTHVKEAIQLLIHKNLPLKSFVKLHFKNVKKIISSSKGDLFCPIE